MSSWQKVIATLKSFVRSAATLWYQLRPCVGCTNIGWALDDRCRSWSVVGILISRNCTSDRMRTKADFPYFQWKEITPVENWDETLDDSCMSWVLWGWWVPLNLGKNTIEATFSVIQDGRIRTRSELEWWLKREKILVECALLREQM